MPVLWIARDDVNEGVREMSEYDEGYGAGYDKGRASAQAELAAAIAQRDKAARESDAMDEFLGAAAKREKEAAAIINSLTADINITVPFRDYTEMSPVDCYELGMMDGVAALKTQINAAIDAAMKEGDLA